MRTHAMLVAWIATGAVLLGGGLLLILAPQPFITLYCSADVCPSQVSGGISAGYLVIALGLVVALVVGIISVVNLAGRKARRI